MCDGMLFSVRQCALTQKTDERESNPLWNYPPMARLAAHELTSAQGSWRFLAPLHHAVGQSSIYHQNPSAEFESFNVQYPYQQL